MVLVWGPITTSPPVGQRFLMVKGSAQQAQVTELIVVHNWLGELKRLAPVEGKP